MENYLEMYIIIYKNGKNIQIVDQAWKFINW